MARRTWDMKNEIDSSEGKDNAVKAYEEYLLLLQQRNRLLAKLKVKDEKQLELERKEQGFSLYLNGANVGLHLSGQKSKQPKTADDSFQREIYKAEISSMASRAKTAPSKTTRKGWGQRPAEAINIKTEKGDTVKVESGVYSGKYNEDFEMYESYLESKLMEEQEASEDEVDDDDDTDTDDDDTDTDDDDDDTDDDDHHHHHEDCDAAAAVDDDDEENADNDDSESDVSDIDEEMDHELTFTVQDVKFLRVSLENDSSIRKSIASISEELNNSDSENVKNSTVDETDISEELLLDVDAAADEEDNDSSEEYRMKKSIDQQQKNHEEILEFTGHPPKARPISASRKCTDLSTIDPIVSEDVSAAIAEENKMILEYQQRRKTKTAPTQQSPACIAIKEEIEDRPVTISSSLTDDDILSITQRVRSLTGRQQKKLLRMLSEIDSVDLDDSCDNRDKNKQYLELDKNNRKSPLTCDDSSSKSKQPDDEKYDYDGNMNVKNCNEIDNNLLESKTTPFPLHCEERVPSHKSPSDSESLEVMIEFLSNWGNENYIGLTEIQFIDCENENINIFSEDLTIFGTFESVENLKNLNNSKTKTTKEKYMWKCNYCCGKKIKINVSLRNCELSKLGKIVMWNYNRNLQELNIGVKDCNVYINGELRWQGVIEKGCGNQIFDYSTIIPINIVETIKHIVPEVVSDNSRNEKLKSPEVVSDNSRNEKVKSPPEVVSDNSRNEKVKSPPEVVSGNSRNEKVKSPPEVVSGNSRNEKVKSPPEVVSGNSRNEKVKSPARLVTASQTRIVELPDDDMKNSCSVNLNIPKISKSSVKNGSVDSKKKKDKIRESPINRSSSSLGSKPVWLEDSTKSKELKDNSDLFLEGKKVSLSRPSSVRRSQQSTPDFIEEPKPARRPISGRRSQQNCSPDIGDTKAKKEIEDLFDVDSMPRKVKSDSRKDSSLLHKVRNKSTGPLLLDMPIDNSGEIQKNERTKFKEIMDTNLEQSFQSINDFNFRHLGRITASIDNESDGLMSFLEPMKMKDKLTLQDKSTESKEEDEISNVLFDFPILPKGKDLIINIKSTWGDRHYVGLNGIEVFSKSGSLIKINNIQAHPSDINVLPEFAGDPRVVSNLIDGCYLTRDDLHLWLTPFTDQGDHFIELEFEDEMEIAMIRIWNYNKSRIHSTRGARFVEMALGGKLIFIGEIARASGVLSNEDPYGDTILFTTDENILTLVATNDFTYEVDDDDEDFLMTSGIFGERPKTADKTDQSTERPYTCPKSRDQSRDGERNIQSSLLERIPSPDDGFVQCKVIAIFFCETWSDQHYLGLTGLEILGETFEQIPLEMRMIKAFPKDLNDLDEYDNDDRTLDKVINGVNVTTADENMWMIPFNANGTQLLKISFDDYTIVTGLRVWNYNKSLEDTFRGAKTIHVYLDDHVISPDNGFLLRKGPGHCHFDFAQDILFNNPDLASHLQYPESSKHRKINLQKIVNEYETIMMPSGFVFQFKLFSSWGDQYYIGLNGIEVYDKFGEKIKLSDNNVTAFPHSVNILDGVNDDVRTPDKLVNNINDTYDGRQMWLAPILPGQVNIVYIVFDEPITISMIKIWNYSKTPGRGVRNFGLLVDDLLVYSGLLPQGVLHSKPGIQLPVTHHTILFTDNEEIALKERKHAMSSNITFSEQNIQLTNDRAILNPYKNKSEATIEADPSMRPMTSVTSVRNKRR